MNTVTLTRKQLFNLVWSESFLSLSEKYNISDVGLRKICKRLDIPIPTMGYWQKVRAGRQISIPQFVFKPHDHQEIRLEIRTEPKPLKEEIEDPILKLQMEIENDPRVMLKVLQSLHAPDELVVIARAALQESNPWSGKNTLRATYRNQFAISVSKPQIGRALRFADTLIKALQSRGHSVKTDDQTDAVCFGQLIQLSLKEKTNRIPAEKPHESPSYVPNGILVLQLGRYSPKVFKDGKEPLEEKLSKILATIEFEGQTSRDKAFKSAINRAGEEEEREVKRLYKEIQDQEIEAFENLLLDANRWLQAEMIRSYLTELTIKTKQVTPEIQTWIEWAKKKADWYDPTVNLEDPLLTEVEKKMIRNRVPEDSQSNFLYPFESYNYFKQLYR